MTLRMKPERERCRSELSPDDVACICSYESTFCEPCMAELNHCCPNCGANSCPGRGVGRAIAEGPSLPAAAVL